MKSKLASLILFASILSTLSLNELKTTSTGSVLEKNKEISGFTSFNKSMAGAKLVSGGEED